MSPPCIEDTEDPDVGRDGGSDQAPALTFPTHLFTKPARYAERDQMANSLVMVLASVSRSFPGRPWTNESQLDCSGTGFVIADRLILTNAHCVADAVFVCVKRNGCGHKFEARVLASGHDCDLSVLTVEDEEFWKSPDLPAMMPLEFGGVPQLQEHVVTFGYPAGGESLCITAGVVSRVDVVSNVHCAFASVTAIQIDAAINPGASGGPAVQGNKVVGVSFQGMGSAQNVGYIIATPVVNLFLKGVERHGRHLGTSLLPGYLQNLESPVLRKSLGMERGMTGVMVSDLMPLEPASKVLRSRDVLLEVDGLRIGNDGKVAFRGSERIALRHAIMSVPAGGSVRLKVLRGGEVQELDVVVRQPQFLVAPHVYDTQQPYYIFGGLVFQPLTVPYLESFGPGSSSCPAGLLHKMRTMCTTRPGQQIVILTRVLADSVNQGYTQGDVRHLQVERVEGRQVLNLTHVRQLVEAAAGEFVTFELERSVVVVLDRLACQAAVPRIQRAHLVGEMMSGDLVQGAAVSGKDK